MLRRALGVWLCPRRRRTTALGVSFDLCLCLFRLRQQLFNLLLERIQVAFEGSCGLLASLQLGKSLAMS